MLRLSLACGDYDRTRPLVDGRVRPLGIDLTCLPMTIEEIFFRMARFREFDAAEMSLGSFLVSLSAGEEAPFVAIPVFPSRSFRHSGIYVHAGSGIERPEQLVGRTVGVAEYQLTANVWVRGILAEQYGVDVEKITWVVDDDDHIEGRTPPNVERVADGRSLGELLRAGDIDAAFTGNAGTGRGGSGARAGHRGPCRRRRVASACCRRRPCRAWRGGRGRVRRGRSGGR